MTQLEILNYAIIGVIDMITDWTEEAIDSEDEAQKKICDAFVEAYKADLEKFASNDTASRTAKQNEIDAAKKAQTFLNERLHSLFSKGIGFADEHLAANNLALTNCGTRSKRLELIETRLDTQLSTLKELKSENEDVDMAETAIKLSSAKYAYDASLMATSKAIQQTLLNYL